MRLHSTILAALAAAAVMGSPAWAGARTSHTHAEQASVGLERDPFASVYIVTSQKTYDGIQSIARNAMNRRDSLGATLMVSEIKAHQLGTVSAYVHEREKRCGGYFAFRSRAEADAFIRSDRAAQAGQRSLLVAYTIDNQGTVEPWLSQVSESNIYATIDHLQGYQNRYYTSSTGKTSAEWIRTQWQTLAGNRSDVTTELSTCSTCSTQPSVILTIQGTDLPNEITVLGAHLDSINSNAGGSTTQRAPGADDDASGIATLTEVIRVALASNWRPKRTVKFMGYAAEETGLRGSKDIAQAFKSGNKNVVGVLQMDMTNYKTSGGRDMLLVTDYSNADLKTFLTGLFDQYLAPLGMTRGTFTCGYACSDHASWTSAGYPSAMMAEGGDASGNYNPNIHTANDTLSNMGESAANSVKFAKLGLAFLGELGKTQGDANSPPVANFTSSINGKTVSFTDTSADSDGSIASRSWDFGDSTTSTATNPSKTYAADGTYTVKLTVTDDDGATNTKSASVTVGGGGGDNVLSNGVAKTGQSGAKSASLRYTLAVPSGATGLKFVTYGGTGDADLYVKFDAAPTTTSHDCKSEGSSNTETCNIATAQAGTYHVLVYGYSAFSGLSITGSYSTGGGGQTYSNTTDYPIADNATVDSPITVSGRSGNAGSAVPVAVNIVHTYIGDLKIDLVAPDGSLYNIHNHSGGSADNINKTVSLNLSTEALNGTWKLRVHDNAANDVGYIDSWSITF